MIGIDGWLAALAATGADRRDLTVHNGRDLLREFWVVDQDWTGATWAAAVRASPDAGGAVLASFTISAVLVGSDTRVRISLAASSVTALGSAPSGEFILPLVWDLVVTPPGLAQFTMFGGRFDRIGKVA